MPVIKQDLPQITSWIWQVRLSYSTLCINCVTSLFPFNPSCSVECSALWSEQFLCRRGRRVVCRGAQQAGEPANGNLMECYKDECKALQMGGITPCTSTWWSLSSWTESLQKRSWWRWPWAGSELLQQGRPTTALGRTLPRTDRVLSLCSALVRHTLRAGSSPGLLSMGQMWTCQDPSEATRMARGWSTERMERGWARWACQPGEGKDSRTPYCNLQWEVVEKMEPNSSLGCTEIGEEAADMSCNIGHTH